LISDLKLREFGVHASASAWFAEVGVGTVPPVRPSQSARRVILISGHDGGTGAAPLTGIKHCGRAVGTSDLLKRPDSWFHDLAIPRHFGTTASLRTALRL